MGCGYPREFGGVLVIFRPTAKTFRVVGYYTGKVVTGLGVLAIAPIFVGALYQEWDPVLNFTIGALLSFVVGLGLQIAFYTLDDLDWGEGLIVTAGAWLWATVLAAIPTFMSGHFGLFADAVFDVMSGFTTTGLTLLQDLDHVSVAQNMWRHILTFAGGQGIVVIALTFLLKSSAGAFSMYKGEGRDDRILPSVVETAKAIWLVAGVYLIVGTGVLTLLNLSLGLTFERSFWYGMWTFMGAWSTGGFAPLSYNMMYYHSLTFEIVTLIIAIAGSMNFALHWAIWNGKRDELRRNIEIQAFTTTLLITVALAIVALAKTGIYPDVVAMARKATYLVVSAHTGTGFSTLFSQAFRTQWGPLAMMVVSIAMMLGASSGSTAGGIKAMRVGIFFKAVKGDLKRILMPETAVIKEGYHHIHDYFLDDKTIKRVFIIILLFVFTYFLAGFVGMFYGYSFVDSLFDGASALSTTGLSCGITDPVSMPVGLKMFYTALMWIGRLEFLSIMVLAVHAYSIVRGR